jgi:hypothetical protein
MAGPWSTGEIGKAVDEPSQALIYTSQGRNLKSYSRFNKEVLRVIGL